MLRRNQTVLLFSTIALLTILTGPAAASGCGGSLVGSWQVLSVLDGTTDEVPSLFTYGRGGTLIATGPTSANSASHGAWVRTAPRMFESNETSFLYGPTTEIIGSISATATLTLSQDRQTYDAEFDGAITFNDGTVAPFSGTAVGSRITAGSCDDDGDSDSDSD